MVDKWRVEYKGDSVTVDAYSGKQAKFKAYLKLRVVRSWKEFARNAKAERWR